MKQIIKIAFALLGMVGLTACKKTFDVTPGTELEESQAYQNVFDADAAVLGIYGKFMGLSDRYIILNELRGDLLESTINADENLRQVGTHNVSADNPYTNPRPFYELILNCNDVIKNFGIMRQKKILNEDQYNQRYSDVASLRTFLYMQLGIHYGEIPYVTDALENIEVVKDESRFPKVKFEPLIDTLINFMEQLPYKELYSTGSSLNITLDGYPTSKFFVNKKILLADLYLWKGNYRKAAENYRQVMESFTTGNQGESYYSGYKLGWAGDFNHYVSYTRPGDINTLIQTDGWRTIFEPSANGFNREWIWALPYDNKFAPTNPLINLFSPSGGSYLVKPSQEIIDNWNSQQQNRPAPTGLNLGTTGIPYDARRLLSTATIGGQSVAMKFLYYYLKVPSYLPLNPLVKDGRWFIYRQTVMNLRFAEAANREGFHRLSYGLFNNGLSTTFAPPTGVTDVTNYMNTITYPDPYKFDARNGEIPRFRSDWYRNIGIRARANIVPYTITSPADSLLQIENGLINEGALENAFEGHRWPDLLRIAMRRNDPAFLADKVYNKLIKSTTSAGLASQARAKLLAKDWFLPFKWQ